VTATDAKGNFRVDRILDGSYRLDITREGYRPVSKDNVAVKAPFRAVVEIVMEPAAGAAAAAPRESAEGAGGSIRVHGATTTRDSGPKGEVRVRMQHADGSEEPRTVLTSPDGTFELSGLSPGSWRIEVLGAGYLPIRAFVDLEGDARVTATLVPQPTTFAPAPEDLLPPEEPIPPPAS
jgi:hypothetical protein